MVEEGGCGGGGGEDTGWQAPIFLTAGAYASLTDSSTPTIIFSNATHTHTGPTHTPTNRHDFPEPKIPLYVHMYTLPRTHVKSLKPCTHHERLCASVHPDSRLL